MSTEHTPTTTHTPKPRRRDRRDPRLPLADMFDSDIARTLWDSLPLECRSDHFDKSNMPERYRSAVTESSAGGPWTTVYLNFRNLPEPMTQEIAWLIHREIELGYFVHVNDFNCTTRVLRAATAAGTRRGRTARSLLQMTPEDWIREVQAARMRGHETGVSNEPIALHRLKRWQDVLVYAYHRGEWWQLNVWNPMLDSRVPQREHEPLGRNVANFSQLTSEWLREAAKLWLSVNLSTGRYSWSTIKSRLDALKWLQR